LVSSQLERGNDDREAGLVDRLTLYKALAAASRFLTQRRPGWGRAF